MLTLDWKSIESMSTDDELEKLEKWTKQQYDKKQKELRIIEIGSFKGKTTALLAQFGIVYAIDIWSNVDQGIRGDSYNSTGQHHYISFIQNMVRLKLIDRVFPITSTSKFLDTLPNLGVDIIFIDGCHFYDEVKQDLNLSFRHLNDDGIIVVHDYLRDGFARPPYNKDHPHHTFDPKKDPWWGVARAVNEFIGLGEFGIQEHFCGIVYLKRNEYIKQPIVTYPPLEGQNAP